MFHLYEKKSFMQQCLDILYINMTVRFNKIRKHWRLSNFHQRLKITLDTNNKSPIGLLTTMWCEAMSRIWRILDYTSVHLDTDINVVKVC
jgi:hypothetical protein